MTILYVDGGAAGNDTTGNGTSGAPYKTLGKANIVAVPGDTVRVRTSTYAEALSLATPNVTWIADEGHTPTITGNYTPSLFGNSAYINNLGQPVAAGKLPPPRQENVDLGSWKAIGDITSTWAALVKISANGVTLSGFTIRNVAGRAITITSSDVAVRYCRTDFTYAGGIWIGGTESVPTSDVRVEHCVVTRGSMRAFDPSRITWGGLDVSVDSCFILIFTTNPVVEDCTVAYNLGEGIWIGKGTTGATIKSCTTHTNLHASLYCNGGGTNLKLIGNISYWCTNLAGQLAGSGLTGYDNVVLGDEEEAYQSGAGLIMQDNLFVGGNARPTFDIPSWDGSGNFPRPFVLDNAYIGFNTFVSGPNNESVVAFGSRAGRAHVDSLWENCIFVRHASTPVLATASNYSGGYADVVFRNNISNGALPSQQVGTSSVVVPQADPILNNAFATVTGVLDIYSTSLPDASNTTFDEANYYLSEYGTEIAVASTGSSVNGRTPPISRPKMGITAFTAQPYITTNLSASTASTITAGTTVSFSNTSTYSGTTAFWAWVITKNGAQVTTVGSEDFSYTFLTTGNYVVTLTGGLPTGEQTQKSTSFTVIPAAPAVNTYYVSPTGNNTTGNGTSGAPWRDIQVAIGKSAVVAGDTIRVRTGTYHETINVSKAITLMADTGHAPTIDGYYNAALFGNSAYVDSQGVPIAAGELPYPLSANISLGNLLPTQASSNIFAPLFNITAAGATADGFIVRNSAGRGIQVTANNVTVRNCRIDFTYAGGMWVGADSGAKKTGIVIEDCVITRGSMRAFDPSRGSASTPNMGVDSCLIAKFTDGIIIRRCTIAYNYGEGIWLADGTINALVEDNTTHTNLHTGLYLNAGGTGATLRRNICYWCDNLLSEIESTHEPNLLAYDNAIFADEDNDATGRSGAVLWFYDNLIVGGPAAATFEIGTYSGGSSLNRAYNLQQAYIGFNTIVGGPRNNRVVLFGSSATSGCAYCGGSHYDSLWENCIILKHPSTAALAVAEIYGNGYTDVTLRNNLSNGALPAAVAGTNGVVSSASILVNPFVAITGTFDAHSTALPNVATSFNPANYARVAGGPAIGMASNGSVANTRTPPYTRSDVGVISTMTLVGDVVVDASFAPSVTSTAINTGTAISFNNTSTIVGTTPTWLWQVLQGTTVIASAATEDYGYTFNSVGNFTVKLTVTTPNGSDTTSVAYIVTTPPGGGEGDTYDITTAVAQSSDDAQQLVSGVTTTADISLNHSSAGDHIGILFRSIAAPPGSTVNTAESDVYIATANNDSPNLDAHFELVANAATFAATTNNISGRTLTENFVTWIATDLNYGWQTIAGLAAALQEVFDLPGWASGNNVALILKARAASLFRLRAIDNTAYPTEKAVLRINVTTPAGETQDLLVPYYIIAGES